MGDKFKETNPIGITHGAVKRFALQQSKVIACCNVIGWTAFDKRPNFYTSLDACKLLVEFANTNGIGVTIAQVFKGTALMWRVAFYDLETGKHIQQAIESELTESIINAFLKCFRPEALK